MVLHQNSLNLLSVLFNKIKPIIGKLKKTSYE
jgi:hypothetical protein